MILEGGDPKDFWLQEVTLDVWDSSGGDGDGSGGDQAGAPAVKVM